MTSHSAPTTGDYLSGVVSCCDRLLSKLPAGDELVRDGDTPSCGMPVVVEFPTPPVRQPRAA